MTGVFASGSCRLGLFFSVLLAFLLLAVLPGCKGGGLSDYEREQKKKEQTKSALHDQGAKITQKRYPPYGNGYVVDLSGAQLTDSTFQQLKGLERVAELNLSKSSLTDDQMDKLNDVAYLLVKLDLSNTAVTDAGVEKLTNLNVCSDLNLAGTQVTKAGVENFTKQRLARPKTRVKKLNVHLK
jgi:uncharacterized protein YjbI with pentapeptide repeats